MEADVAIQSPTDPWGPSLADAAAFADIHFMRGAAGGPATGNPGGSAGVKQGRRGGAETRARKTRQATAAASSLSTRQPQIKTSRSYDNELETSVAKDTVPGVYRGIPTTSRDDLSLKGSEVRGDRARYEDSARGRTSSVKAAESPRIGRKIPTLASAQSTAPSAQGLVSPKARHGSRTVQASALQGAGSPSPKTKWNPKEKSPGGRRRGNRSRQQKVTDESPSRAIPTPVKSAQQAPTKPKASHVDSAESIPVEFYVKETKDQAHASPPPQHPTHLDLGKPKPSVILEVKDGPTLLFTPSENMLSDSSMADGRHFASGSLKKSSQSSSSSSSRPKESYDDNTKIPSRHEAPSFESSSSKPPPLGEFEIPPSLPPPPKEDLGVSTPPIHKEPLSPSIPHDEIVVGPRRPICFDIFLHDDQDETPSDQTGSKPRARTKASGSSSLPSPARKKKLKGKAAKTTRDDSSSPSLGKVTVSKSADFADGNRGNLSFDPGSPRRLPFGSPFSRERPEADTSGFQSESILKQVKAGVRHDDIVVGPRRNMSLHGDDAQSSPTGGAVDDLVITEQPMSPSASREDSKSLKSVLSVDSGCDIAPVREFAAVQDILSPEATKPVSIKEAVEARIKETDIVDTASTPETNVSEQAKASTGRWRPKEKQSGAHRVRRGRKGENVSSESGYATDITSKPDTFDANSYKNEPMTYGTWDRTSASDNKSGSNVTSDKLRSKSASPSSQIPQEQPRSGTPTGRAKSGSTNTTPIKRQIQPVKLTMLSSIPIPVSQEPPTRQTGGGSRLPVPGGARPLARAAHKDSGGSHSSKNVPFFPASHSTPYGVAKNHNAAATDALSPQEIASLEAVVANSNKIPTRDKIPRSPPLPRQQLVLPPPLSETDTPSDQMLVAISKPLESLDKTKRQEPPSKQSGSSNKSLDSYKLSKSSREHLLSSDERLESSKRLDHDPLPEPESGKSSSAQSTPSRKKPPGSLQLQKLSISQPLLAAANLSTKQDTQTDSLPKHDTYHEKESLLQRSAQAEQLSSVAPQETSSVESTPKKKSNLKQPKADDQSSLASLPSSEGTVSDAQPSTMPGKPGSPVKPRLHRSAEQLFKEAKLSIFNSSENIRQVGQGAELSVKRTSPEKPSGMETPPKVRKSQLPRAVDSITPLRKMSHDITGKGRGLGLGLPRRGSDRSREILRRGSERTAVPVGVHDPSGEDLKKATSLKELCQSMASLLNIDNERAAEMLTSSLSQRQDLVEGLDADAILDYLTHHGVLDRATLDTSAPSTQRNSALIRHVEEHGQTAVALFINALRQSGQLHLASSLDTEQRIKPASGDGYFGKGRHKGEVTIRLEVDALKLWAPREPRTDHAINASLLATPSDQAALPFDLSEEEDSVKPRSCWCFCFPRSRSKSGNSRKSSERRKNSSSKKYTESSQQGVKSDPSGHKAKDSNIKPHRTKSKEKKKKDSSKDKKGKKGKGETVPEAKEDLSAVPDVVYSTRGDHARINLPADPNGKDTGSTGEARSPGSTSRPDTEGWDPIVMEYDPQLELVKLRAGQEELASPTRQSGNIGIMCEQWKSSGKFFQQKAAQLCSHIVREYQDGIIKYFEQDRGTLVLDVLTEGSAVLVVNICMKRSQIEKLQTDIDSGALLSKFKELFLSHVDLTVWDIRGVNFRFVLDDQQLEMSLSEFS